MAKDKAIQKLDERLAELCDKVIGLAYLLEEGLTEIFKVLKNQKLLTYDEYADSRELLREIRDLIEKLEKEEGLR